MNPESHIPNPEVTGEGSIERPDSQGQSEPQSREEHSRADLTPEEAIRPAPSPARFFDPEADEFRIGLELERLEATYTEPSDDYDYEDDSREHELLMHDLADDNDDFARSNEDGWYYSDEG